MLLILILLLLLGIILIIYLLKINKAEESLVAGLFELAIASFITILSKTEVYLSSQNMLIGVALAIIVIAFIFVSILKSRLYILNIKGYYDRNVDDYHNDLRLGRFNFKELEIDYINCCENYDQQKVSAIISLIERKTEAFVRNSKNYKKAYTGIAHIPLTMIAGTYLRRVPFDVYLEFDRFNSETYKKLNTKKTYPVLQDYTKYHTLNQKVEDVVLAISTTTHIYNGQLRQFGNNFEVIYLGIDTPEDNAIYSIYQLKQYNEIVMRKMESLPEYFSYIKRIHLVCSTQNCLALEIGKNIEDYRNYEVISYHFDANHEINYPWGIIINGKNKGRFIKGNPNYV